MSQDLTRQAVEAVSVRSEAERLIDLRIMPWGVVADTPEGAESFARGAFAGTDPGRVTITSGVVQGYGHEGFPVVGRGTSIEERDDAAYLTARIAATPAGDELLTLAQEGILQDASVEFRPRTQRRGPKGEIQRTAVDLRRVAVLQRGAYQGAAVLAVRSEGGSDMTDTIDAQVGELLVPYDPAPILTRIEESESRSRAAWDDMAARLAAIDLAAGRTASPLARFAGFGEFCRAAYTDRELARALVDEITFDNPGLMLPTWLSEIVRIAPATRPVVTAFGGPDALPASGMSFSWPSYTGDIKTLVQKQAAEKTAIHSEKISFGSGGPALIESYGFGHDVAYQLILRSDPSYIASANRVLLSAFYYYQDAAFSSAILAAPGKGSIVLAIGATADAVKAAFFEASLKVKTATGAPASIVLASDDWFAALGGLAGLTPGAYGTQNVAGTAQASTLRINVSGLEVINDSFLPAGTLIFSNEQAASYHAQGPMFVTADEPERIGRNEAIWGMGASAIMIPAGIVVASATQAAAARAAKGEAAE